MNLSKAGIVGCGLVGATIAYTLMQSPVFREMVLIDKIGRASCRERV